MADEGRQGEVSKLDYPDTLVVEIRNKFYDGVSIEALMSDHCMSLHALTQILDGHYMPYAGGPLRVLPLQGCNPKYLESTRNRQRFVRGVIKRAAEILDADDFRVFANFNGMSEADAKRYARNSEDLNERLAQQRYGGVLGRHAQGTSLEESVIAYSGRSRTRAR